MDSRKDQIFKIFAIIMLHLYLRSATATNIDCDGKSFHCVNSTHFMICVDLGGGVSTTVNDFLIQCPPTTVCNEKYQFECTYELPMTTQLTTPSDETKDFTTDAGIITTFSNDITNTISSTNETSVTRLFNEYLNLIEVTTSANYEPDMQTHRNKVSGMPEMLNNDKPTTTIDHSNSLTAATDTVYSVSNSQSETPELKSAKSNNSLNIIIPTKGKNLFKNNFNSSFTPEKNISEPSFTTTTIKDIEIVSNLCDGTSLSGDPYLNKLTDTTYDTIQSTTYLSNETKDFTTDTGITSSFSDDITNTISSTNETSVAGLFNEYFNVIEVTTSANYEPDGQTHRNKVTGMPEMLNNDKPTTTIDPSNSLTDATDTVYSVSNSQSETPELNSAKSNNSLNIIIPTKGKKLFQNNFNSSFTPAKNISEPSFITTTIKDIEIVSNLSDGTILNGDPYLNKLTDTTYDTIQSTTYLSNETKDFTTDTGITSSFLDVITNTISSTNETSVAGLFNEYFNVIEVTTSANYEPDGQTHRNKVTGMPEMSNNDKPTTTIDPSNSLTAATDTVYSVSNSPSETPELNSAKSNNSLNIIIPTKGINLFQNNFNSSFTPEKNISEPSFITTTIKDIEIVSNLSDGTTLSGHPYLNKLTDTTYDTIQSTTYLSNETKDFTTDTGITTSFSNDITNTISSTNKTSVTGLFNEYSNTSDVTTLENYEREVPTYKNEVSAMPEMLNNDKPSTIYNKSNGLTKTPKINSAKRNNSLNTIISTKGLNLLQNNLNLSFTTEKNISEPSFATTTINDIEITTNLSDGTALIGDPYMVKLIETTYDTTIETTTRDLSTWRDQDADTLKDIVTKNTLNSDTVTKSLPEMIHTTQPTLLTLHPWVQDNNYYENTSSGTEDVQTSTLFDRDNQKIHEIFLENSLTSVNTTQPYLVTPEENISKINLTNIDSSNFTSTRIEGNIKLSTEANVMENIIQMKLNKTLSTYELNIPEITESDNITNVLSTLEPKITSSVYVTETKVVDNSTVSKIGFDGNEMLISPKGGIISTVHIPITSENYVNDVPKFEMTSFDYKLNSESSIPTPTVNEMGKEIQNTITEKISPDDDIQEGASTIITDNLYFDHITSPIDYGTTITELNFSEQNIQDNKSNMLPLYEQHNILGVPVLSDISTTYANIPNILTTLELTTKSMESVTETIEAKEITAPYSIDVNGKIFIQKENANQMNTISGHDNYNSYEIMTEVPKLNTNGQSIRVTVTKTSRNTTENTKLLSEEETVLQMTPSVTENDINKSQLNLEEQVIRGNKTSTSFSHQQNIVETTFPENFHTTNIESSLSNYDFSTSSLPSTFEQATIIESLKGRKQAIESTTLSYFITTPYLSQYQNANKPLENYSTQSEYLVSNTSTSDLNETISTFHKEHSTPKPSVQDIINTKLYDIKKTNSLNNISPIKDSIVSNPGTSEVVSNMKVHENVTLKPEHTPMTLFNSHSEYTMTNNVQPNEVYPISNSDWNSNTTPLFQDEKSTFIVQQDDIFTITENPNILDLNQDTENSVYGDVNLVKITTDKAKTLNNTNNNSVILEKLYYKKSNELMSSKGVDQYIRENVDKITAGEKMYDTQNQDALNDSIRLASQDPNIQSTEKLSLSTPKYLMTTSVAKVDVHDQIASVFSETYQVTDNPNDMVKNSFIHVLNNKDQEIHANVNHIEDKLTDKVIGNETEVTIQNQEASSDTMGLILQDKNIQSSKKFSPSKSLMTTLVSKEDEILLTQNQITTVVVAKNYQATDKPNDMIIDTTNNMFKNSHVLNNQDKEIYANVNHIGDELTDKVIGNETEVTIQNQEASNDTMRLTLQDNNIQSSEKLSPSTPKYLMSTLVSKEHEIFPKHNKIVTELVTKNYLATENPNDILINTTNNTFKNSFIHVQNNQDQKIHANVNHTDDNLTDKVISPVLKILNSNMPSGIVENRGSVNSVQKNATSINIANVLLEKSRVQLKYNNDSVKVSNTISNVSSIVTTPTILDSKRNLLHTLLNSHNNTTNNVNMKNEEFNASNEERIFNKKSVVVSTEIPKYETVFIIEKSNTIYKDGITVTGKTPLVHVSLDSDNKGEINTMVTESTGDLYVENKKALKEHNSTGVTTKNTSHSNIPNVKITYLGSVETIPYQPPVDVNQTSFDANLKQTISEGNLDLNSTYQNSKKAAAIDHPKKVNITVTPRVISNINKRFFPTESRRKINIGTKDNKRSTNTTLFRCNRRIRGRFADKNNCRKFYICIGKNKPILGECPSNTVFSEIKKQCTKNLSHCIRNNQFRCTQEGRFSDVLRSNIYYICVNNKNAYVRFTFRCQNGFHLNKTSVKCVKDIQYESQMSTDSISYKDQSTVESKSKKKKQVKEDAKSICSKEGKFPDGEDCRRYYVCTKNSKSVFRRRTKKCDSDEVFDREKKKCVDRESYECI